MNPSTTAATFRWLILGDEKDPRVQNFQKTLHQRGVASTRVVSYQENWAQVLPDLLTPDTCLRIESPASDLSAVHQLMLRGNALAEEKGFLNFSDRELKQSSPETGEFIAPHLFYFVLKDHLEETQHILATHPIAASMNHIPDILLFYDKQRCHQHLQQHNIPQAKPIYSVTGYADLREKMQQLRINNVFIKTRFGSGASGMIALKTSGDKLHAQTTLQMQGTRFYNTRKLQVLQQEQALKPLVDALCQWGVHCEAWIPKATIDRQQCDCRLLVIDGSAQFAILRKSKTPMTNLHLLNQRGEITQLSEKMTTENWQCVLNTGKQLASLFPDSFHFAPDIAVHQNKKRHSVLEVNAFGDYLRHIKVQGKTPYEWQLDRFMKRLDKVHNR